MIAHPSHPWTRQQALELAEASKTDLSQLITQAGHIRDQAWGRVLTYSPKVFLPLTNLCRDRCDYCGFRRSPGEAGEWTMSPEQVIQTLDQAQAQGCIEALFCLGDSPDRFPSYRQLLSTWGHANTTDYLFWAAERALERGLLPHTNAGILSAEQMQHLKGVNVSLGLMLESVSERLCEPGMPHHHAPDKHPQIRLTMTAAAGKLRIPFTSGILVGMGETPQERVDTLAAIQELHQCYGHIQEVIVQPFRIGSMTPLTAASEPSDEDVVRTIALARLMLPPEVSVQTPPNLNATLLAKLIQAGINDFGGISPITPDYINPDHPWPHLAQLAQLCAELGFQLQPRLPIYQKYQYQEGFLDPQLQDPVRVCQDQLSQPVALPLAPCS